MQDELMLWLISAYSLLLIGWMIYPKLSGNYQRIHSHFGVAVATCAASLVTTFYLDVFYLVKLADAKQSHSVLINQLPEYLLRKCWLYLSLCFLLYVIIVIKKWLYRGYYGKIILTKVKFYYSLSAIISPIIIAIPLPIICIYFFAKYPEGNDATIAIVPILILNSLYSLISVYTLLSAHYSRVRYKISIEWLKKLVNLSGIGLVLTVCIQILCMAIPYQTLSTKHALSLWQGVVLIGESIKANAVIFLPLFALLLFIAAMRSVLKKTQFDETTDMTHTGNFGTATFATKHDLEKLNIYDINNGPFIGADSNNNALYLPLVNKLTISPPGGGKTTSSSIPILLTHNGPVFAFDIKGELWAVTSRYRSEVLGREVVAIDPFGVTRGDDFKRGKPEALLKKYHFNPFDWIPEDKKQRDRMINAFAASFVINEGGFATHFDDNAKILIRGYIDYLMSRDSSERTLPNLYQLMSESIEDAQNTFEQMAQLAGRAGAAANQISRVGSDERGSILSTSYRQIDWMGDSNIQETLSHSNFDLRDFLKGNMDLFIILPEDQVKEHNRLFRMVMSLLMNLIVQSNPSELPKQKMLFLLEELAQLGASPDVEQCIEVMRIRGVVIWTVFQALKQIEQFTKPDLFLSMPLKQIFTNDDIQTMQWVQTLGGKKTVLTKTLSTNKGDSRQKMQAFGGSISSGEGESVHETGVDLIQLNEIRELPKDEQYVFLHGVKPIRCKKIRYFEHRDFIGKYDPNPLELRH